MDKRSLLVGAAVGAAATGAVVGAAAWMSSYWRPTGLKGDTKEERVIASVFATAKRGDPASVLAAFDEFGWKSGFLMNVGDVKGKILRDQVVAVGPKLCLEFGGYCGYSAVLIGSLLSPGSRLISIELNPTFAAISTKIIEFAGLSDRVHVWVGEVATVLPQLVAQVGTGAVDLVFVDHWKDRYLPDLHNLERSGLLHVGSVVVGDNIYFPGAPDYLAYVQSSPSYATVLHETMLEYHSHVKDAMTVSTVRSTTWAS